MVDATPVGATPNDAANAAGAANAADAANAAGAPRPIRFGVRAQLIVLFTLAFTVVFAGIFYWASGFVTQSTGHVLRDDLHDTLKSVLDQLDGDDIATLYAEGTRNKEGTSDDKRWRAIMDRFHEMNRVEPKAWASVVVRGDMPNTRRVGPKADSPEFIFLAELAPKNVRPAQFLESRRLGPRAMSAWENHTREDVEPQTGRFGLMITTIAPVLDRHGRVVALLAVDYDAHHIERMQSSVKRSIGMSFAIAYAVVLVLVFAAAGIFTRPIIALTRATERLDIEHLDGALALAKRPDELGALARAYNRMSRRLAKAFGDLARANEDLERRVLERTAELSQEREKSERLLRNVLPAEIAERLKLEPQVIAEGYEAVTVLFADIVGFTAMSARSSPLAVVRLLNDIFSSFDKLADKYRLEKIKTIGDAYMIVGGLPTPRADHAIAVADMALEMQTVMATLDQQYPGLSIRIGSHSGPVVAGVIGTKKFSYDLWGDTVNVASRMESHGDPGRVQVSAALAELLRDTFELESRGLIKVKGRGEMETFWLLGRRR